MNECEDDSVMINLVSCKKGNSEDISTLREQICQVNNGNYIKLHVFGKVKNFHVKGLADTGNNVKADAVMSEDFHKKLGVGFKSMLNQRVNTAKEGASMIKIGISKPVWVRLIGTKIKVRIAPVVIRGLSDPLNLGLNFLTKLATKLPVQINFCDDKVELSIGDQKLELVNQICESEVNGINEQITRGRTKERVKPGKRDDSRVELKYNLTTIKGRTLMPRTMNFVDVEAVNKLKSHERCSIMIENQTIGPGVEIVRTIEDLRKGRSKVAVINTGDKPFQLKSGERIAKMAFITGNKKAEKKIQPTKNETDKNMVDDIWRKLQLDDNEILKKNSKYKEMARALLEKHYDVFVERGSAVGTTDMLEFDIELLPGAKPVKEQVRPLNPDQLKSLRKQIDEWLEEGVIEPSTSSWASALVPAKKKGAMKIRWCCDYRRLNQVTRADSYPLPNIEQNLESLRGAKIFSALDAAQAYSVIPISERSKEYLAFITPYGLFQPNRMQYGARNSAATYARFVELAIMKLRCPNVLAYLDDIIAFNGDFESHIETLDAVFRAHKEAGILLRPQKTHLFKGEVNYLGYKVSQEGIKMDPDYIKRILEWPKPTTVKEMTSFLGFCGYYRMFIPRFSEMTCEMNSQRKNKYLEWSKSMEEDFEKLKDAFKNGDIRAYPDYESEEPFLLTTDFSAKALGAILSQVQNGKERFLGCAGRKTTRYEANYHSMKGELAAVVFGCRKFEHILKFKKFKLITDSAALKFLHSSKNSRGVIFRWMVELSDYNFDVEHKKGSLNKNADALSRSTHLPDPTDEQIEESMDVIHEKRRPLSGVCMEKGCLGSIKSILGENPLEGLQEYYRTHPDLRIVMDVVQSDREVDKAWLKAQTETVRYMLKLRPRLVIEDGLLKIKKIDKVNDKEYLCYVVDEDLFEEVFKHIHNDISGHLGILGTQKKILERFFGPGLSSYIRRKVNICGTCVAKQVRPKQHTGSHHPSVTGHVMECLFVDLYGPLNEVSGYKYILTIQDGFSRYVQLVPLPNKEASTVARGLLGFVGHFSSFLSVKSDNGKEFINAVWKELMKLLGVKHKTTVVANPSPNISERFHRVLGSLLRCSLGRNERDWLRCLPLICLAFNSKESETTGVSPFEAFIGRKPILPVDLILPPPFSKMSQVDWVQNTRTRLMSIYRYMCEKQTVSISRNSKLYQGVDTSGFRVGDKIFFMAPLIPLPTGKPGKLSDRWLGPASIERIVNEMILDVKFGRRQFQLHVSRVKKIEDDLTVKDRSLGQNEDIDEDQLQEADTVNIADGEFPRQVHFVPDEEAGELRNLGLGGGAPLNYPPPRPEMGPEDNIPEPDVVGPDDNGDFNIDDGHGPIADDQVLPDVDVEIPANDGRLDGDGDAIIDDGAAGGRDPEEEVPRQQARVRVPADDEAEDMADVGPAAEVRPKRGREPEKVKGRKQPKVRPEKRRPSASPERVVTEETGARARITRKAKDDAKRFLESLKKDKVEKIVDLVVDKPLYCRKPVQLHPGCSAEVPVEVQSFKECHRLVPVPFGVSVSSLQDITKCSDGGKLRGNLLIQNQSSKTLKFEEKQKLAILLELE